MISHNISLAVEYADTLLLVKQGKVHERKTVSPQEIADCFNGQRNYRNSIGIAQTSP